MDKNAREIIKRRMQYHEEIIKNFILLDSYADLLELPCAKKNVRNAIVWLRSINYTLAASINMSSDEVTEALAGYKDDVSCIIVDMFIDELCDRCPEITDKASKMNDILHEGSIFLVEETDSITDRLFEFSVAVMFLLGKLLQSKQGLRICAVLVPHYLKLGEKFIAHKNQLSDENKARFVFFEDLLSELKRLEKYMEKSNECADKFANDIINNGIPRDEDGKIDTAAIIKKVFDAINEEIKQKQKEN